jgi:hypothetical protein
MYGVKQHGISLVYILIQITCCASGSGRIFYVDIRLRNMLLHT